MRFYAPILAALVIAGTAMSGLINVNFQHNLHLPAEISQNEVIIKHKQLSIIYPFYTTKIDIRLKNEIKDTDSIKGIIRVLQEAQSGDIITFHLAGYGGQVDSVVMLINNIKSTKAFVIMSVEAPVYSGHAYLAMFGHQLKLAPYTYLMFHASSAMNLDCSIQQGTDRGVSNIEHCEDFKKAHLTLANHLIVVMPFLTPEEKIRLFSGHDVYLFPQDIYKRTN